jgi:hypothetical protein
VRDAIDGPFVDAVALIRACRPDTAYDDAFRRLADQCMDEYEEPTEVVNALAVLARVLVRLIALDTGRSDESVLDNLYSYLLDTVGRHNDEEA